MKCYLDEFFSKFTIKAYIVCVSKHHFICQISNSPATAFKLTNLAFPGLPSQKVLEEPLPEARGIQEHDEASCYYREVNQGEKVPAKVGGFMPRAGSGERELFTLWCIEMTLPLFPEIDEKYQAYRHHHQPAGKIEKPEAAPEKRKVEHLHYNDPDENQQRRDEPVFLQTPEHP